MFATICQSALDRPTIQRIDSLIQKFADAAVQAHPNNALRQDRWLRDKIVEDAPPDEATMIAMQCDHYLLCLRVNAEANS
jgi:hypothetical protein